MLSGTVSVKRLWLRFRLRSRIPLCLGFWIQVRLSGSVSGFGYDLRLRHLCQPRLRLLFWSLFTVSVTVAVLFTVSVSTSVTVSVTGSVTISGTVAVSTTVSFPESVSPSM